MSLAKHGRWWLGGEIDRLTRQIVRQNHGSGDRAVVARLLGEVTDPLTAGRIMRGEPP